MRALVGLLVLAFNEAFGLALDGGASGSVRAIALAGLLLNGPYYVAARTGRWPRAQAHARILGDVTLVTAGLFGAGGLAAAQYVSTYMLIPVYAGIVFSSAASVAATVFATASYLTLAGLQQGGWLPFSRVPLPNAWSIAAFNLLMLNLVAALTAFLAEVYRRSRRREVALHQDLERANRELLTLNAEIQRAARLGALGEVVAGVAHEIRNVQQVAFGSLALARRQVARVAPDAVVYLDRVEDSCEATMRIVRNALDMARRAPAERAVVSLAEIAGRVLELKRYDLRRDDIGIRLEFPPGFPPVHAAPLPLQQVLLNLVANAHDALRGRPAPRVIAVAGVVEGPRVVVEVWDTGPGIPPEVLPRILEPFYTTKPDGTGLGLAISAGLVRDLGGELTAGNHPRGGALFRISLRALPAPPAANGAPPPPS